MKAKDDDDESGTRTKTTSAKLPTPLNETEASEEEKTTIRDKTGQDCNFASIRPFCWDQIMTCMRVLGY